MKKRLLLLGAVLLLGVVAGVIFVNTTPSAPLAVVVTAVTNHPGGGKMLCCTISNQTAREYVFFVMPQTLTDGAWVTTAPDGEKFGGVKFLKPHGETEQIVHTAHDFGTMRPHIRYVCPRTPIQLRMNRNLRTLRLPALFDRQNWRSLTTPPTNFLAR